DRAPEKDERPAVAWATAKLLNDQTDKKALERLRRLESREAKDALKYIQRGQDMIFIDIPYIHQAHNHCGISSATMTLRHQGEPVSQFQVKRHCPGSGWAEGAYWTDLLLAAKHFEKNWAIETYRVTDKDFETGKRFLLSELNAGRPVIIDWLEDLESRSAHSIVLCGYDETAKEYYFKDPALTFPGIRVRSEEDFRNVWRSIGFVADNRILKRALIRIVP
ncbi:MAG: C39 family peptidase, partial [Verrucomicrobiota bacterium]